MTDRDVPPNRYDVIIAADMTAGGDLSLRIALEIHHYAALGHRVGLVGLPGRQPGRATSQEIAACVRRNLAVALDPQAAATTQLLIVHAPSTLELARDGLAAIAARKIIMVAYQPGDFAAGIPELHGPVSWAPIDEALRRAAPAATRLTRGRWLPPPPPQQMARSPSNAQAPAIGWLVSERSINPPYESPPDAELFALVLAREWPRLAVETNVIELDAGHLALERLLGGLGGLAYFPAPDETGFPDALIVTALHLGRPVALPDHLKSRYGDGPIYCESGEALRRLIALLADARALERHAEATRDAAASQLVARLPALTRHDVSPRSSAEEIRPVVFVAGGSTGLGHVTRLLAIARKLDPQIPVLFVCQAHAVNAIERLGYVAEYIPSASYVGGDPGLWNQWLRHQLDELLDTHDPSLVVFDGNHLYPGLVKAAASRPDCRLAWVRRGLWGGTYSRFISNARWCDTIIEPGELAGQPDEGVTARRRAEAQLVAPIRLIDMSDILSRQDAAKAIGLDPDLPAVLVQLGANSTRETVSLIDPVISELRKIAQLQICVAEFAGTEADVGYWPGVTYVRGFPLSQYAKAFDFSISAAGYNTFHEAIAFGIPTIFIPNRDPSMDDQAGRADFAQNAGAAFVLEEDSMDDLPNLIRLLLEPKGRDYLINNCQRLALPNGANQAAAALGRLLEVAQ